MKISILTKFLLRIAKNNNLMSDLNHDIRFKLSLYDVNLSSLVNLRIFNDSKYNLFIDKVRTLFNVDEYIKKTFSNRNNIVITNIDNYDKLSYYLESNGVMWGSCKRCTKHSPINNFGSEHYIKLYMDECRIYYGYGYSKMIGDIVLTENKFYEYYENYKEILNEVFYRNLIKDYGCFKKNIKWKQN